jgi:hypothetical protein
MLRRTLLDLREVPSDDVGSCARADEFLLALAGVEVCGREVERLETVVNHVRWIQLRGGRRNAQGVQVNERPSCEKRF